MREWIARVRDWLRRDQLSADLSEELAFHQQLLERDAALSMQDDALNKQAARRQMGNITNIQESARDRWSIPWLDHLQRDIRYALRGLRRSPAFTATVIVTLALGIGANTAMFGVIDRLMFRPDPYLQHPALVHRVYMQITGRERVHTEIGSAYTRYLDFRQWTGSFSKYAAIVQRRHAVGTGDATTNRRVTAVSASYFSFFNARPVLGRLFTATEDSTPAGANVALLSYDFWRSEFGQRNVIGTRLQVGNASYTIIGVTPASFVGVSEGRPPSVYLPITAYIYNELGVIRNDYFTGYNWTEVETIVERKLNVTTVAASRDLTNAFARSRAVEQAIDLALGFEDNGRNPRAFVGPLKIAAGPEPGLQSRTLLWVASVSIIVLLIACANVANLLLARALTRRREVALRVALGVSRARLIAQSLTETMVLALLGGTVGVLVAQWGGSVLQQLFNPLDAAFTLVSDWRTLSVALLMAMVTGVLTCLAPLVLASDGDISSTIKAGARDGTYQRSTLRAALLVTQGALSVVLLAGAGFFIRSLDNSHEVHYGFDGKPLLIAEWEARNTVLDSTAQRLLRERMLDVVRAMPIVESAAWANTTPLHVTLSIGLALPGADSSAAFARRFAYQGVGVDYFATMRTRILQGRGFFSSDGTGKRKVTIVSESMARALWPARNALGQCLLINTTSERTDNVGCTTVVGISEDVVNNAVSSQRLRYYLPAEQVNMDGAMLLVRVRGEADAKQERVRHALQTLMPGLSFVLVHPFHELLDDEVRSWHIGAAVFTGFGVLALIVAAVGLYGVISYTVAERRHELGVRMALGASSTDIVGLVVGQGVRLSMVGVVIGTAIGLAAARWVQPLLFHQSARDPLVFFAVGVTMLLVALVAGAIPARRVLRADPNIVLRSD